MSNKKNINSSLILMLIIFSQFLYGQITKDNLIQNLSNAQIALFQKENLLTIPLGANEIKSWNQIMETIKKFISQPETEYTTNFLAKFNELSVISNELITKLNENYDKNIKPITQITKEKGILIPQDIYNKKNQEINLTQYKATLAYLAKEISSSKLEKKLLEIQKSFSFLSEKLQTTQGIEKSITELKSTAQSAKSQDILDILFYLDLALEGILKKVQTDLIILEKITPHLKKISTEYNTALEKIKTAKNSFDNKEVKKAIENYTNAIAIFQENELDIDQANAYNNLIASLIDLN